MDLTVRNSSLAEAKTNKQKSKRWSNDFHQVTSSSYFSCHGIPRVLKHSLSMNWPADSWLKGDLLYCIIAKNLEKEDYTDVNAMNQTIIGTLQKTSKTEPRAGNKNNNLSIVLLDACILQIGVVSLCEFYSCISLEYFIGHNYSVKEGFDEYCSLKKSKNFVR